MSRKCIGSHRMATLQIVAVVVSVGYNFYFDVRYDWGLLDVKSSNWLLRNKLIFPRWVRAAPLTCWAFPKDAVAPDGSHVS